MNINVSKGVQKGCAPSKKCFSMNVSLISEQFVFNLCSKQNQFVPLKKCKPPWWTHSWTFLERKEEGGAEKPNIFERFFADSTLTFLTFGNTFRLVFLPTRRAVLLRGRERKIRGRQIKIRGRQIFPGCAPKIPVFKGKVTKKGGAEAPPISLYKYNTFRRQKQEVLKPKKGVGCGKGFGVS